MKIERSADHSYRLDGMPVPGVTRTLSALFPSQFDHVDADVLAAKRDVGIAADAWCELDDRGMAALNTVPAEVEPFLDAWRTWKLKTGFVPVYYGQFVASRVYRFAGQLDVGGYFNQAPDDWAVVDRKCVRALSPLTALQVSGYKIAAIESIGVNFRRKFAVQLRSDGRSNPKEYKDPLDEGRFLALLGSVNWARNAGLLRGDM